jgi:uncharacterized protein (DUF427 family)
MACERRVRIELAGEVPADSIRALRVLETSHPPTFYVPLADVREELLAESDRHSTWCEFKGVARYLDAVVDRRRFEVGRLDAAWLSDERVQAQQTDFYGGWIGDVVGPFNGPVGTLAW